jgi:hypothetical protein
VRDSFESIWFELSILLQFLAIDYDLVHSHLMPVSARFEKRVVKSLLVFEMWAMVHFWLEGITHRKEKGMAKINIGFLHFCLAFPRSFLCRLFPVREVARKCNGTCASFPVQTENVHPLISWLKGLGPVVISDGRLEPNAGTAPRPGRSGARRRWPIPGARSGVPVQVWHGIKTWQYCLMHKPCIPHIFMRLPEGDVVGSVSINLRERTSGVV